MAKKTTEGVTAARKAAKGKRASRAKPGNETDVLAANTAADGKLSNKEYARELKKLHVELVKLQEWVKAKGLKVCIVFEGRNGAGKGGFARSRADDAVPRRPRAGPVRGVRQLQDRLPDGRTGDRARRRSHGARRMRSVPRQAALLAMVVTSPVFAGSIGATF